MSNRRILILIGLALIALQSLAQPQNNKPTSSVQVADATGDIAIRPVDYNLNVKVNYVRSWDAMAPFQTSAALQAANYQGGRQSTQYLDGLGRTIQSVIKQASPGSSPKDLVSANVYDAFGRETLQYLPYVQSNNITNDGKFKTTAFTDQDYFYKNSYKDATNTLMYANEQALYGRTTFEASPLNRIEKSFVPGNSWAGSFNGSAEKAVNQKYLLNNANDLVRVWNITYNSLTYTNSDVTTNIPTTESIYGLQQLTKSINIDENDIAVVEYKDKSGQVILKKVQNGTIPSDYSGYSNFLCTYYVYDDFGQLRFVIPPLAVEKMLPNWGFNDAIINELCFRYEFDDQQRLIAKKVPGAGWVYLIYDSRDRLVFTQDANMRANNQWLTTLYDALNRPVLTGMTIYNGSPSTLQSVVNSATVTPSNPNTGVAVDIILPDGSTQTIYQALRSITILPEFETGTDFTAEIVSGTSGSDGETTIIEGMEVNKNPLPTGASFIPLTMTLYDSYEWAGKIYNTAWNSNIDAGNSLNAESIPTQASKALKGMVTGTKVRILENPSNIAAGAWLSATSFYDEKGRVIQMQSDNHKGGADITTYRYDFSGKVITGYLVHQVKGAADLRIKTNLEFDHGGRLLEIWKTINDDNAKKALIARNSYDALGQLQTKELGRKKDANGNYTSAPIEKLDYNYNIRGWLKGINQYYAVKDPSKQTDRWFGMELFYDWGFGSIQYNGNISGTKWRSRGDEVQRAYGFTYDAVNRLLGGDFSQGNGSTYTDDAIVNYDMQMGDGQNSSSAYDENGNIKAMKQWGLKLGSSTVMDDMAYSYFTNTNKLRSVTEQNGGTTVHKLGDFTDKHTGSDDYGYDKNGNLVSDLNKRINGNTGIDQTSGGAISYNHLNLPYQIAVKDDNGNAKGTITYTYDAAGNKLKKVTQELPCTANGNHTITTTTFYVGGAVYETKTDDDAATTDYADQLQHIGHEEGRIRPLHSNTSNPAAITSFEYDYMVKDHLGNVRMVLTEEKKKDIYPVASLEDDRQSIETNYYTIDNTKIVAANTVSGLPAYTNDNGIGNNPSDPSFESANSQKLYKLNSSSNKTGLGMTLKVMSGDVIDIFGKSYYFQNNTGGAGANSAVPVLDILNGLLGGPAGAVASGAHGGVTASQLNGLPGTTTGINQLLNNQTTDNNSNDQVPKAYINYLFFDEQFKCVGNGFSKLGTNGSVKDHHSELQNLVVPANGYVYIYASNESPVNVFFDNLQVVHTRGALLEETHYYPFGLTMVGISSKALEFGNPLNRRKFNDGSELNSDLDISLYETRFRGLDPQIGRWLQIDPMADSYKSWSPYVFALNNPLLLNDPTGLASENPRETSTPDNPKVLQEVIVKSKKYKNRTIDLISRTPTVMDNIVKDVPWSQLTSWSGEKIDKYFRNYVDKHPEHYKYLASKYISMRWAKHGNKIVGAGELYDVMVSFLDYGLAAADNQVSPLPDPSGISSMIAANLSADLDESILSQALTLAAKGVYSIEGLGRVFNSLSKRGHGVPLTGTYVSSGELLSIFLNGGIVNPNLLTYKNYGFTDTAPSKEGVKYNHFILYNDKTTLPIIEKKY